MSAIWIAGIWSALSIAGIWLCIGVVIGLILGRMMSIDEGDDE